MTAIGKTLEERIGELEKQLHEKETEAAYYQQIAEAAGKRRLREVDQLLRLIAEQKKSHEEKARLEVQLQQTRKMETIGMMAAGVAHDLNNVLAGIVGFPDLILLQLAEDSPLRTPIQGIRNSGMKATAIVQDLLTLARKGSVVHEVINLNDVIRDYLGSPEYERLRHFHPTMVMETDFEPTLRNILGSPVHLCKVVMNLVSNAAEAMPHGGAIRIATRNCPPVAGDASSGDADREGGDIVMTVSDMGTGMSARDQERIFDPFFTKKKAGRSGTGLGMTVVWGTVKDHNGRIEVQSELDMGTTFTLYFPSTGLRRVASEKTSQLQHLMGNGESILVVDDVAEQRDIAASLLGRLNYAVSSAISGEEALQYLAGRRADLVILDMIMAPGINGLETYRRIIEIRPDQKAIIASGFSEPEHTSEARRLGINRYLQKPYTLEAIGRAVKAELS